jgi:hypothetical protein
MGIKHLIQENPSMEINLIRLLSKLDPSKTNKFTPFLLKIFKEKIENFSKDYEQVGGPFGNRYQFANNIMNSSDGVEKLLTLWIIDHTLHAESIEILAEFNEVLEKGLIEQNDISKYKDMSEIINQLSIAKTKDLLNKSRKEISVVYEDDTVMMLKPLSFEASLKYGAGTKWCTAMKNEPEYFYRYSKNGILIYLINKVSGRKFGCYSEENNRVNIYNEVDESIDSFHMGLPYHTLTKLMGFLDRNLYENNVSLFSEEEMINHNKFYGQKVPRNYDELVPMEDGMEEVMALGEDLTMQEPSNQEIMAHTGLDNDFIENIRTRLRPVMRVVRRDTDQEEIEVGISDDGFEGFASRYDNDLDSEPQVEERG